MSIGQVDINDNRDSEISSAFETGLFKPEGEKTPDSGSLVSLEGVAVHYGIPPVELPRAACNADAEALVRKLGRWPQT
ncbi:MAG: hypothetical protein ACC661_09625, partial [Verrucomicrobiales bacterium]